jgi:glucose-6-phosphate 1-dehydrogenase
MHIRNHYNKPTAFVIFGGTGDLAQTKLLPALFHLYVDGRLPQSFIVIGLSRKPLSDTEYQEFAKASIHTSNKEALQRFCLHIQYRSGAFDNADLYSSLKNTLNDFDTSIGQCTSKLFYLAVPPTLYSGIFTQLKVSNAMSLCDDVTSWARILVEKPFGNDITTAEALEVQLCDLFSEDQIYRIDHYLAKDAIENTMSLRFSNPLLSKSWNSENIESIAISLKEHKDVANRGAFYDAIGALRDVGQNHMLQMLALLTMDPVDIHDASAVRKSRAHIFSWLSSDRVTAISRGQYEGYQEVHGVSDSSQTETYFRVVTTLSKESWANVPITLSSGKALDESKITATIVFNNATTCTCGYVQQLHSHANTLTIEFAPRFTVSLTVWVKKNGFEKELEERVLTLVDEVSDGIRSPEAYEKVLYDCIVGDQRRFVSGDEIKSSWEFITPLLEKFATVPLVMYKEGTDFSQV